MSHSTFLGKGLYQATHLSEKGRNDRFGYLFLGQIVDFDPASGTAWAIGKDRLLRSWAIGHGCYHVYPLAVGPQIRADGFYSPEDVQALLGPPPRPEPVGMPVPGGKTMQDPPPDLRRILDDPHRPEHMREVLGNVEFYLRRTGLLAQCAPALQIQLKPYKVA